MKLLLMTLMLMVDVLPNNGSCPQNEEPSQCFSHDFVPQVYCPNVEQQEKWHCKKKSYMQCVCKGNLHRRDDGKCVPEGECAGNTLVQVQPPPPKKALIDRTAELTLQFLKSNERLHLQMMRRDEWVDSECECLGSSFLAAHIITVERTLDCYKYVINRGAPTSISESIKRYRQIKKSIDVDFQVTRSGSEIHVHVWLILFNLRVTHHIYFLTATLFKRHRVIAYYLAMPTQPMVRNHVCFGD
ncbi:uncharacterized protein LOC119185478 isoform X2 [Rhipicephalus microplus]|uniref:uncharacterized protein LOC119185478 isoform X2 n=1 Tax=Rhipicephalus microplus TaxID=6941 RepID=UPI003F6B6D3B